MIKKLYILLFLIFTHYNYGQHISFEKNVNYSARDLSQNLNADRDSLFLESVDEQIAQVDIFNDTFSESIAVHDYNSRINLKALPTGNFIVQAHVDEKLIVMYLKINESVSISSTDYMKNDNVSKKAANKINEKENPNYYWVVSESNSNFGSRKSMKLEYKENVAKLISKNKLELKSTTGKNNKLLVYAVYNKSKFMNEQFRNPKYYKSEEASNFIDTKPFYTSKNEEMNGTTP